MAVFLFFMDLNKPLKIKKNETNRIKTSSGDFFEYISWKQCKDLAVGIGVHNCRFPQQGYLISKIVNEVIFLLNGSGDIVVKDGNQDKRFSLEKDAIIFIPKKTPFYFDPKPQMEIFSATGPGWFPKQQLGLDYSRKESGRMIL